ncbi:FHA domain-containing protein FHA2-like [Panicum miliaceum]|uniref:FHA domain-containing protein FHA2-like n=1 Tax=Panicum miliaceum TaxID=4540 RepID=A0A3L6PZQ6_PANMI|nr:FHA domain-containing protein FHA2-like [Panicum miliaceum]
MGNPRRPGATASAAATPASSEMEVGFAKLHGECFEYYMQTYSIILGRHSRRGSSKDPAAPVPPEADDGVDVDLGALGGGMNVSRRHARIFYDFPRRRFALEVLGKNGCLVEGVHHLPGSPPVKLDSQDLLQMGDAKFYFLLPSRSVFGASVARRAPAVPRAIPPPPSDDDEDEGEEQGEALAAAKHLRNGNDGRRSDAAGSKAYKEADDQLLLQLEEKDVISSAATILSDLCGPQEWVSMNKLHEVWPGIRFAGWCSASRLEASICSQAMQADSGGGTTLLAGPVGVERRWGGMWQPAGAARRMRPRAGERGQPSGCSACGSRRAGLAGQPQCMRAAGSSKRAAHIAPAGERYD